MVEADELLSSLAAIGEDGCSAERKQQARSAIPDATFWAKERSTQQLWLSTDVDMRSVGRGMRELLLNSSCKMDLATLYFHMLASKDAPVRIQLCFEMPQRTCYRHMYKETPLVRVGAG